MQPGGHLKFPAGILCVHAEIGENAFLGFKRRFSQHFRHPGHARAVAAGIGGLGINSAGNEFGKIIEQLSSGSSR